VCRCGAAATECRYRTTASVARRRGAAVESSRYGTWPRPAAWRRRNPTTENLLALAGAVERRGKGLVVLAEQLRGAADKR
jgi:hypothetical protein